MAIVYLAITLAHSVDPLPSWNDGEVKSAIVQFVTNVATEGNPSFVPSKQRIAAFGNDGTLWAEQPVVQIAFASHQIKKLAPQHPEWKT